MSDVEALSTEPIRTTVVILGAKCERRVTSDFVGGKKGPLEISAWRIDAQHPAHAEGATHACSLSIRVGRGKNARWNTVAHGHGRSYAEAGDDARANLAALVHEIVALHGRGAL